MGGSDKEALGSDVPIYDPRNLLKTAIFIVVGTIIIYFLTYQSVSFTITATLMITYVGFVLWITELLSFALSSIIVLVLYSFTNVASLDLIFSGFASGAVFLILGGMMLAQGVNNTSLGHRVVYFFLKSTSYSFKTLLFGIILIPQVLAIFIPATGVRTALILPIILSLISLLHLENNKNHKKQMMLAVAYGGNISGIGFLPAAIGNILIVEIILIYTGRTITYFDWLLFTFPIWLLCIPITWYVVMNAFPTEMKPISNVRGELDKKLKALGSITNVEKRCIVILIITVALWATQDLHGLHPSIPTLFAVVLMGLPVIGISPWERLSKIDINTIILVGATLSVGRILVETGSIDYLSSSLFSDSFISLLIHPFVVILFVTILTQVFHLVVSNVSTAVVTITPVVIALSEKLGLDPLMPALTVGIASLLGFILIVETIPNVLVSSTGHITQRDFFKPGIILTIYTAMIVILVAVTWWHWLGVY